MKESPYWKLIGLYIAASPADQRFLLAELRRAVRRQRQRPAPLTLAQLRSE